MTTARLAKLVLAFAVAFACVTPLFRLVELGVAKLPDVLPAVPVIMLLAWALLGFVLVGRGPGRSALILSLLLGVVLVSLGELIWASHALIGRVARYGLVIISPIRYPELALGLFGIPILSGLGLRLRLLAAAIRSDRAGQAARTEGSD
ncbi:hypothetical protein P12x_005740 [Tundrisphaera lichenicola]|uniref:hypothetical protein n=1 Tax=Tundrisphaera lichenicola TaxID=2029860 RepID=UPI003EBE2C5F